MTKEQPLDGLEILVAVRANAQKLTDFFARRVIQDQPGEMWSYAVDVLDQFSLAYREYLGLEEPDEEEDG